MNVLGPEAISGLGPWDLVKGTQAELLRERCHHVCKLSTKRVSVQAPDLWVPLRSLLLSRPQTPPPGLRVLSKLGVTSAFEPPRLRGFRPLPCCVPPGSWVP